MVNTRYIENGKKDRRAIIMALNKNYVRFTARNTDERQEFGYARAALRAP
jgi:hypothetical protein